MRVLGNLIGIDVSPLIKPWRLTLGLSVMALAPVMLAAQWASSQSQAF